MITKTVNVSVSPVRQIAIAVAIAAALAVGPDVADAFTNDDVTLHGMRVIAYAGIGAAIRTALLFVRIGGTNGSA